MTQTTMIGDLRVCNVDHEKRLVYALAESQLMDTCVHSTAFGLDVFEGDEWLDWENEDGVHFDEWCD